MISDQRAVELAELVYAVPLEWERGGVGAARFTEPDGTAVVAFPGTDKAEDAIRDARAWPTLHPELGFCHAGFLAGIEGIIVAMISDLEATARDGHLAFVGHSLGGALAILAAAMFVEARLYPMRLVTFGAPRVGCRKLKVALDPLPGSCIRQYRNGDDPVTEVPTWPYRHPRPLTPIGQPRIDPVACHRIAAYRAAMAAQAA